MKLSLLKQELFGIDNDEGFIEIALELFQMQAERNPVLKRYLELTGRSSTPTSLEEVTFLPIEFFKHHEVILEGQSAEVTFLSSGTGNEELRSRHCVSDLSLYKESFRRSFELFIGEISEMHILSLLPNYEENKQSSLLLMVDDLIEQSLSPGKKNFGNDQELIDELERLKSTGKQVVLFGVSFALLNLAEKFELNLDHVTILETGGMKGRRKELTRSELHSLLNHSLKPRAIYSEYGMTELLSQAYTGKDGLFSCPPWMKVMIRDIHDPFSTSRKSSGAIDVIDLANMYSVSFISTSDLGRMHANGHFEVLGRLDYSDVRGCNLLFGE